MNHNDEHPHLTLVKPAPRHRRPHRSRWLWFGAVGIGLAGGVAAGLLITGSAQAGPTVYCQQAVDRQNAFVATAVSDGYPDGMTIPQAMAVQEEDLRIINAALKVCPPDTKVEVLP